jgi:hypothetical protein
MLAFLDKIKIFTWEGVRVKIFKKGIREVYLLLYILNKTKTISGDLLTFLIKQNQSEFRKINNLTKQLFSSFFSFYSFTDFLKFLLMRKDKKLKLLQTIYQEVLNYNVGSEGNKSEDNFDFESFTRNMYYSVSQLFFYSNRSLEEIFSLTFEELRILLVNLNYHRFNKAVDSAGAWSLEEFKRALKIY